MRKTLIVIGSLVALLVVLFVAVAAMSPSSEVVTLVTVDARGTSYETQLWIIDNGDTQWLRAGNPDSPWAKRLRANSDVDLVRAGDRKPYRAIPVETTKARDRLNAAMAEKYGASNTLVSIWSDHEAVVPIRIDPR